MQWILHDIPIGRNIQNIRMQKKYDTIRIDNKDAVNGKQYVKKYSCQYRDRTEKYKSK